MQLYPAGLTQIGPYMTLWKCLKVQLAIIHRRGHYTLQYRPSIVFFHDIIIEVTTHFDNCNSSIDQYPIDYINHFSHQICRYLLFLKYFWCFFKLKIDGIQRKVNLLDAKATAKAEEWDNMTVEDFKTKTLWTQGRKCKQY